MAAVSAKPAVPVVAARAAARENTVLKIEIPQELRVGASNIIRVILVSSSGQPAADQTVALKINGENDRRGRTSFNGSVDIEIRQNLNIGPVHIEADFDGSSQLNPTSAAIDAEVKPGVLEIPVVPAVEGVVLTLDGVPATSGPDGVVRFPLEKSGEFMLAFAENQPSDKAHIAFHRWSDENFSHNRQVAFPLKRPLQLGLDLSYEVTVEFYDLAGSPVPPERIKSYTIKGSNGTPYTFTDLGPHLLPASRVTRRALGLEPTKIQYSVMDVQVDGSNVVTQAQQRFFLDSDVVWRIDLLFYSASFTARDALFGFPLGSGIDLHYPDGRIETLPFTAAKTAHLDGLARGLYQVRVSDAPGFSPLTPMALSKDQEVDLLVVSYLDMMVVAAAGITVAVGLILIGRPGILAFLIGGKTPRKRLSRGATAALQVESRRIRKDGNLKRNL